MGLPLLSAAFDLGGGDTYAGCRERQTWLGQSGPRGTAALSRTPWHRP